MKRSVICNAVLAVMELAGIILSLKQYGPAQYQYFTEDINLFSFLISVIYCIYGVRELKGKGKVPKTLCVLRNIIAINLVMVFIVCLTGGIVGYKGHTVVHILFTDCSLFFHTLCPGLSAVMALFPEKPGITSFRQCPAALVPPVIYSAVIIPMNILRVVHGPYTYLYVYEVSAGTVVMATAGIYLLTFIIAIVFICIKKRVLRNSDPEYCG